MSLNGYKITAPISIEDVRAVLSENTLDLKSLCMSPKINPWAKYKPIAINEQGKDKYLPLTDDDRKERAYGLEPAHIYVSTEYLVKDIRNEEIKSGWRYNKIGVNNWARLTDFDGYNHKATHPFGNVIEGEFLIRSTDSLKIPMSNPRMDVSAGCDNGELNLKDFNYEGAEYDFANWYIGLCLVDENHPTRYIRVTKSSPIVNNSDWQIDFGILSQGDAGVYMAVPFLSNRPLTKDEDDISGLKLIALIDNPVQIILYTASGACKCNVTVGYTSESGGDLKYFVSITNATEKEVDIKNVILAISKTRTGDSPINIINFGSPGKIASGASWSKSGDYTALDHTFYYARLSYSCNNASGNSGWVSFFDGFKPPVVIR